MALKDVLNKVAESYGAANKQSEGLGKELAAKVQMKKEAEKALNPEPVAPAPKPAPKEPAPGDKINPKAQYGDKPGEKRIDVTDMVKPLGKMHKGGEVKKSGAYELKKGEHVLTEPQKGVLGLAAHAMSHVADEEKGGMPPKKEVKEMRIRKGASGGHIINHAHTHFSHPDEEHVTSTNKELMAHVMEHMANPEKEEESEGANDGGKGEMESAVGY